VARFSGTIARFTPISSFGLRGCLHPILSHSTHHHHRLPGSLHSRGLPLPCVVQFTDQEFAVILCCASHTPPPLVGSSSPFLSPPVLLLPVMCRLRIKRVPLPQFVPLKHHHYWLFHISPFFSDGLAVACDVQCTRMSCRVLVLWMPCCPA
jgi:hypothetical protein